MEINITIFLISLFSYGTILLFLKYSLHKIALIISIVLLVLCIIFDVVKSDSLYFVYSIMAGIFTIEIIKKIIKKFLFSSLKIKTEEEQEKYLEEKLNKSIVDILIEHYEKSDGKIKENENNKAEEENKKAIESLEERIKRRKNKTKTKKK